MWRDEIQTARACRALLGIVGLERLWTTEGPTSDALQLRQTGGALGARERTVMLGAFAVWDGSGHCSLAEVLELDAPTLAELAGLLLAVAVEDDGQAVDEWLALRASE